jgi:hypothetical protein
MASSGQPPAPWFVDPTLHLEQRIAGAPDSGLVKGWLFQSVLEQAAAHGVTLDTLRRYLGFKDYPVTEYLELLAQAAVRVRPDLPAVETCGCSGTGSTTPSPSRSSPRSSWRASGRGTRAREQVSNGSRRSTS